ncbi:MAG: hypothetical protein A3G25_16255 [Betaproteobacteria bacterium RIFCSPLOWO2_12_FULL_63_13]|nr:MAG: hypothetical protein A3G25_16255 [Betaproteobacteria bacterium RIFCSPLOWO2_12_FULL_63_13]
MSAGIATMHPVVLLGAYGLDSDRMPADEFQIRMAAANTLMDERGWRAIFAYGDATEHRELAWLTNFIPRLRWALALLPRQGAPRLLTSMSPRDVAAMKLMTWIGDVHSGWSWSEVFDPWLDEFCAREGANPAPVGLLGRELMRPTFLETMKASAGARLALEPATGVLDSRLRFRRSRELVMLREACHRVDAAADAMQRAWRAGADGMSAAIEAERAARAQAAHDVRVLFSVDGGATLLPFYGVIAGRSDPMLAYIAVKYMGYWADAFVTFAQAASPALAAARQALDALLAAARPGADGAELARAATPGGLAPHPVIGEVVGHRIGHSLAEGEPLAAASPARLEPGGVYTLRVGAADPAAGCALLSAMIRVSETGVEVMRKSV